MSYGTLWQQLAYLSQQIRYCSAAIQIISTTRRPRNSERNEEASMNSIPAYTVILALIVALVVLAAVAWLIVQRQRSARLKRRFGAEYDVAVSQYHSRAKAEAELLRREQRVAGLTIVPLTPPDTTRFSQAWIALQSRFVDNPKGVVADADQLVREVMAKRGYPMGDFDARAADISVDHPGVVANYRAARVIAARDVNGEADTEELRKAVVHYRTLFEELLDAEPVKTPTLRAVSHVAVHQ